MGLKKVLFVNDEIELYGAEISLLNMARSLNNFMPIVLLPGKGPLQKSLQNANVKVIIKDFPYKKLSMLNFKFISMLKNVLEENGINILHLNKAFNFIPEARIASGILKIPIIVHVRGKYWPSIFEKAILSHTDKIVCISEYCKNFLIQNRRSDFLVKIPKEKVEVIYNGINLEDFIFCKNEIINIRKKLNIDDDEIAISLVGYFNSNKGQDRFVNLAYDLFKECKKIKFFLIGDAINEEQRKFKEKVLYLIEKYNFKNNFIITGYVDIKSILPAIDILVNLSKNEGLSRTIIEAMAAQKCVLANSVGGIPEVIGTDGAGFLVESNNIQEMKEIILKLIVDKDKRDLVGIKAKRRISNIFDIERQIKKVEEVYKSILLF